MLIIGKRKIESVRKQNCKTQINYRIRSSQNGGEESSKGEGEVEGEISDMEGSQVSLPRSYTLPREFKYNHPNNTARERERRVGSNKVTPSRFYLPSTNSSDGTFTLEFILSVF